MRTTKLIREEIAEQATCLDALMGVLVQHNHPHIVTESLFKLAEVHEANIHELLQEAKFLMMQKFR